MRTCIRFVADCIMAACLLVAAIILTVVDHGKEEKHNAF